MYQFNICTIYFILRYFLKYTFQFYSKFCYIISFQCEKCNYLALIGGGGSDQFTASEKLLPPPLHPPII